MKPKKRGARILVADDDPGVRRFLGTALQHFGYRPHLLENGTDVLHRVDPGAFDVLLMDLRLGSANGADVLRTLRERGVTTPAILMSSHFPDEVTDRRFRLPDVFLLQKPFTLAALRGAIAEFLRKKH